MSLNLIKLIEPKPKLSGESITRTTGAKKKRKKKKRGNTQGTDTFPVFLVRSWPPPFPYRHLHHHYMENEKKKKKTSLLSIVWTVVEVQGRKCSMSLCLGK
jgi:hypothetical protein